MLDEKTIGTARLTLPQLSDRLGRSPAWGRDLRSRDSRFPPPDGDGRYSLMAVVFLLHLRELERQSDADFEHEESERRRGLLADMEPGGRLAFVGPEGAARIAAVPARTRQEAIAEAEQDFARSRADDFPRGIGPRGQHAEAERPGKKRSR